LRVFLSWNIVPPDPPYWEFFEPDGLMVSLASLLNTNTRRKVRTADFLLSRGLHTLVPYGGPIMVDSLTSFLSKGVGNPSHGPRSLQTFTLYLQTLFRPHYVLHKDYPAIGDTPNREELISKTILNAHLMLELSRRLSVTPVIVVPAVSERRFEETARELYDLGVDHFAIGGLWNYRVGRLGALRFSRILRRIVGDDARIHLLGSIPFKSIKRMILYVDSVDTSIPIKAAKIRHVFIPRDGRLRRVYIREVPMERLKGLVPEHMFQLVHNLYRKKRPREVTTSLAVINAYILTSHVRWVTQRTR